MIPNVVRSAKLVKRADKLMLIFNDRTTRIPRIEIRKTGVRVGCVSVSREALEEMLRHMDCVGVIQEEGV